MKTTLPVLLLLIALVLGGCGPAATEAPPPPTSTPTPQDYLNASAAFFRSATSFRYTLGREGTPVVIEPTLKLLFVSAEGAFQAPDQVYALVMASLNENILALNMLWLPEGNYMSNPLTQRYAPMPPTVPINPLALFAAEGGLATIMETGVKEPTVLGIETLETIQARHLQGMADAAALKELLLVEVSQDVQVDFWLDVANSSLVRLTATEATGDVTTMTFSGYNQPVEIPKP